MGQEAAPGLQRLVHVVSSIYFEELVFSRVQSEISRAYVAEMENELQKNPRGAAQAVMQLQQQQQDDMRRLQMERFRRLLVNFDDDISGSPGNDDDDGEVEAEQSPYVAESRDSGDAQSQEDSSAYEWRYGGDGTEDSISQSDDFDSDKRFFADRMQQLQELQADEKRLEAQQKEMAAELARMREACP